MTDRKKKQRIVVAMSGGVDSSVTAAMLQEQGYEVIGISMQLWSCSASTAQEGENSGPGRVPDGISDARQVAEQLGIPFYGVNFEEEFQRLVIDDFVGEYLRGRTPNPCVCCNQRIKFGLLLQKARELAADYLATGHYARVERDDAGRFRLLTGQDAGKDQSYFLYTLTQEQLSRTLFPLGEMTKPEVRRLAARYGLRVAEKGESQEICFVPDNDYVRFLEEARGAGELDGDIVDSRGNVLGRHRGTYRYTVGQRKGLGVAHPHPLYVLGVDTEKRQVVVGSREELASPGLVATDLNWIIPPPGKPLEVTCKIRYRHRPVPCTVIPLPDNRVEVRFTAPEKSVTPGQAVVFYREDEVLGGGCIEKAILNAEC